MHAWKETDQFSLQSASTAFFTPEISSAFLHGAAFSTYTYFWTPISTVLQYQSTQ